MSEDYGKVSNRVSFLHNHITTSILHFVIKVDFYEITQCKSISTSLVLNIFVECTL